MTPEEKETVIQFDDSNDTASVYTCHKWLANALIRRKLKPISVCHNGGKPVSWDFHVPKSWIHVRPPRKGGAGNPDALKAARMAILRQRSAPAADNMTEG